MVQDVLDELGNDNLRVYVVWTPVLREDNRTGAGQSVACIPDSRAVHFWDEDKSVGLSFGKLVTLPRNRELAWDVYFVFDGKAEWTESPPKPTDWMHQLGLDERLLNGDKLRDSVEKLLSPIRSVNSL